MGLPAQVSVAVVFFLTAMLCLYIGLAARGAYRSARKRAAWEDLKGERERTGLKYRRNMAVLAAGAGMLMIAFAVVFLIVLHEHGQMKFPEILFAVPFLAVGLVMGWKGIHRFFQKS